MMRAVLLSLVLLAGCCGPRYGDFFLYHDDGTMKPKVAMVPVISWDKSDGCKEQELKSAIVADICGSGQLFVYSDEEIAPVLNRSQNCADFAALSACFRPADFAVEVIIVQDACFQAGNAIEHVVKARLQIMDIRCDYPKILLFETIEQRETVLCRENHRPQRSCLYDTLATKIAERIESAILCH